MFKLGVQVSIAGKIYHSIDRAKKLGCNTMQIFARNPRQWRKGTLSEEDIKLFKEKAAKAKINPVVIHIPYTLNLASAKEGFYKITIREFTEDLLEADKLGAHYLVTHMGSHKGISLEKGLDKIVEALKKILANTKGVKTKVLLENTAGSGRWVGYTFSHHKYILEKLNWSERVGLCLDTAHAWAAGYKISEPKGVDSLLSYIDKQVGMKKLKVVHLNDNPEELGSRRDRHFDIGKGKIGKQGFYHLINHPCLKKAAFILETPKKSDKDDIRNLNTVRSLHEHKLLKGN